jgi:hypothetical protein
VISVQVLNELAGVMHRKLRRPWVERPARVCGRGSIFSELDERKSARAVERERPGALGSGLVGQARARRWDEGAPALHQCGAALRWRGSAKRIAF